MKNLGKDYSYYHIWRTR